MRPTPTYPVVRRSVITYPKSLSDIRMWKDFENNFRISKLECNYVYMSEIRISDFWFLKSRFRMSHFGYRFGYLKDFFRIFYDASSFVVVWGLWRGSIAWEPAHRNILKWMSVPYNTIFTNFENWASNVMSIFGNSTESTWKWVQTRIMFGPVVLEIYCGIFTCITSCLHWKHTVSIYKEHFIHVDHVWLFIHLSTNSVYYRHGIKRKFLALITCHIEIHEPSIKGIVL